MKTLWRNARLTTLAGPEPWGWIERGALLVVAAAVVGAGLWYGIDWWRNGRFIFEDRPLAEVVETFERYLPGRIVTTRQSLRQKRLSGNFDLSNPGAALADLAAALEIRLIKAGPYLTVLY